MNDAERFLSRHGWNYRNTESAARMVASLAQLEIDELTEKFKACFFARRAGEGMTIEEAEEAWARHESI